MTERPSSDAPFATSSTAADRPSVWAEPGTSRPSQTPPPDGTRPTQILDLRQPGATESGGWTHRDGEEAYWLSTESGEASDPLTAEPGHARAGQEQPGSVDRGLGGPVGALIALVVSIAVAGASASLPTMSMGSGRGWGVIYSLLDVDAPRTLSSWWGTVLFTLAGVWCWAAGRRARLLRRFARAFAWGWVGLAMIAMSASHQLALHTQLSNLDSIRRLGLPNVVSSHPVEFLLLALMLIPGVILMATSRNRQRVLLAAGALSFVLGSYLVGGALTVSTNGQYQHVAEVGLEWAGLVATMFAASLELTHRGQSDLD